MEPGKVLEYNQQTISPTITNYCSSDWSLMAAAPSGLMDQGASTSVTPCTCSHPLQSGGGLLPNANDVDDDCAGMLDAQTQALLAQTNALIASSDLSFDETPSYTPGSTATAGDAADPSGLATAGAATSAGGGGSGFSSAVASAVSVSIDEHPDFREFRPLAGEASSRWTPPERPAPAQSSRAASTAKAVSNPSAATAAAAPAAASSTAAAALPAPVAPRAAAAAASAAQPRCPRTELLGFEAVLRPDASAEAVEGIFATMLLSHGLLAMAASAPGRAPGGGPGGAPHRPNGGAAAAAAPTLVGAASVETAAGAHAAAAAAAAEAAAAAAEAAADTVVAADKKDANGNPSSGERVRLEYGVTEQRQWLALVYYYHEGPASYAAAGRMSGGRSQSLSAAASTALLAKNAAAVAALFGSVKTGLMAGGVTASSLSADSFQQSLAGGGEGGEGGEGGGEGGDEGGGADGGEGGPVQLDQTQTQTQTQIQLDPGYLVHVRRLYQTQMRARLRADLQPLEDYAQLAERKGALIMSLLGPSYDRSRAAV